MKALQRALSLRAVMGLEGSQRGPRHRHRWPHDCSERLIPHLLILSSRKPTPNQTGELPLTLASGPDLRQLRLKLLETSLKCTGKTTPKMRPQTTSCLEETKRIGFLLQCLQLSASWKTLQGGKNRGILLAVLSQQLP